MSKTLPFTLWGENFNLTLIKDTYVSNGNLYLGLFDPQSGPFADLTTNIDSLPEGYAAVDTNNDPWAEEFITANNLGENTGQMIRSGFCTYPIYKFNMDRINEYIE